jgi:hypothetical protein
MDFTTLSNTDIYNNEELLAQYLKAYNPELDTSVGTAIRELIIIPAALYYTATQTDINNTISNLSIANCTDPVMLSALLSNYNVVRKTGTPGTGYIAVFSNSSTDIIVPQKLTFTVGSNILVLDGTYIGVPDLTTLNVSDLTYYRQIQQYDSSTWFIVIPATTAGNLTDVLSAGQSLTMSAVIPGLASAEIASTFSGGSSTETDAEMKARVAEGITAKVPSGKAHVEALCKNVTTATVYDVSVAGMGDVEMLRGKENSYGVNPGGRVDIYTKTALYPSETTASITATCIDPSTFTWKMMIPKVTAPGFYMISELTHSDYESVMDYLSGYIYNFSVDTSGETYVPDIADDYLYGRFTKFQTAEVTFQFPLITSPTLGQTTSFNVKLLYMPQIDTLQNYFSAPDVRNQAGDYLIKAPVPVFVGAELNIKYPDYMDAPDIEVIRNLVVTTINSTPMKRGYVTTADIAAAVKSYNASLVTVMPIILTGLVVKPDGSFSFQRSVDTLSITQDTSQSITKNTLAFYSTPTMVSISLIRSNQYMA